MLAKKPLTSFKRDEKQPGKTSRKLILRSLGDSMKAVGAPN